MNVAYISPSVIPSRSANAVHVVLQCDGLARVGAQVTLYAKRTIVDADLLAPALSDAYGIDARALRLATYYSDHSWAETLRTAVLALTDLVRSPRPNVIVSRNLYASFALAVIGRRPLIFETHQLETGARKFLQGAIMTRPWVTTIAISHRLVAHLAEHHGVAPAKHLVLRDAAPEGIEIVHPDRRRALLASLVPETAGSCDAICGYFGHLYAGRGIEVIAALAAARPRCLFLVYGGNDSDVARHRETNFSPNLMFMGHAPYAYARRVMGLVDVLLMPYQESVGIGVAGHDTAGWMSPMKMFEYLATGVPIISSDLPALREVLRDEENCLLVPPTRPEEWIIALDRLTANPQLGVSLGFVAHGQYRDHYTWTRRAQRLLAAAEV